MILTPDHAKYFANEPAKRCSSDRAKELNVCRRKRPGRSQVQFLPARPRSQKLRRKRSHATCV
jgi:hypothetical protein